MVAVPCTGRGRTRAGRIDDDPEVAGNPSHYRLRRRAGADVPVPALADVFPRSRAHAARGRRPAAGRGSDPDQRRRRKADCLACAAAAGFGLLALSYRGYGGSTGKPTEGGLLLDAAAAYDFAAARYPNGRIVLWGESLGTGVAVALAAVRRTAGLILDAPFTSAADIGASAYPFIPVRWFIKDAFRSDERIGQVRAPLLVLHGEQDRIVPVSFGERLFSLANEPKRMVRFPRAGHVDLDDHGAPEAVRSFLNGLTGATR